MAGEKLDPIAKWEIQLRKGSLELGILAALWEGERYGLEIVRRLADTSRLNVPEGTIYPLLARLRAEGWVDARWVESPAGHPRKYYRLSAGGRRHALALATSWSQFAAGLDRLVEPLRKEPS